jgi:hypothetical protein
MQTHKPRKRVDWQIVVILIIVIPVIIVVLIMFNIIPV